MRNKCVLALSICLLFATLRAGDNTIVLDACKQLCDEFAAEVYAALHDDMLNKGVIGTVETCAERIDKIGHTYSERPGITVERTTLLRLKEQKRGKAAEAEILRNMISSAQTEKEITEDHTWIEDEEDGKTFVYVRAVKIKPLCLSCHGPSELVQPAVKQLMVNKYKALPSGNQLGETKGAIVVRLHFPEAERFVKEYEAKRKEEERKSQQEVEDTEVN